jgi:polysaccharide deacetylase 2 family uncharacterized protein YibQ
MQRAVPGALQTFGERLCMIDGEGCMNVPTRRKSRRRKRSPIFLALFLFGGFCFVAAAAMWLWSPDGPTQTAARSALPAAAPPTAPPTAPPDIPARPASVRTEPAAAEMTAPPTPRPEAAAPTSEPPAGETPAAAIPASTPYAAPAGAGAARLAIIIDDCGQWPVTERGFVALPFPVTLSVLPHVRFGSEIARDASAAGKGVMLHLPMQTVSGTYPGPGTITIAMDDAAIRSEVSNDLAELPEARGVNNHEGSRATQDARVMGDIADVLAQDGRFFIDSRTSKASVGEAVARGRGVPSASRTVFLDNVNNESAIEARLLEAAKDARATGSAIAIGHPRPATLAAVRALGPKLAAAGIDLTLASALVH